MERLLPPAFGVLSGAFAQLNRLAETEASLTPGEVLARVGLAAAFGAVLLSVTQRLFMARFAPLASPGARGRLGARHALTYGVFLLFAVGATGFRLPGITLPLGLAVLFAVLNGFVLLAGDAPARHRVMSSFAFLGFLFFVSGMAALVYQVTWQRLLYASFGVNIESVTLIVTIFMFGLGIGSLWGGRLSRRAPEKLPGLFLLCELLVGAFGLASVPLIKLVGAALVTAPPSVTGFAIFALLAVPTLLMGATLPILVAYANEQFQNVGRTVGLLYFVNTLGSAAACFLTADVLFVLGGQQAAVLCAAAFNLLVAALVWAYARAVGTRPPATAGGEA
ncbi:MAG TPA: hypothetical protein VK447_05620 [Myxococcaceae bacterium]|nr:hypothetical protein [Myxococcaceae bacterium]